MVGKRTQIIWDDLGTIVFGRGQPSQYVVDNVAVHAVLEKGFLHYGVGTCLADSSLVRVGSCCARRTSPGSAGGDSSAAARVRDVVLTHLYKIVLGATIWNYCSLLLFVM